MAVKKIEDTISNSGINFLFCQKYAVGPKSCHVLGVWSKDVMDDFIIKLRDSTGPKSEVVLVTRDDTYRFRNKKRIS